MVLPQNPIVKTEEEQKSKKDEEAKKNILAKIERMAAESKKR